jgi:hypothetical protein
MGFKEKLLTLCRKCEITVTVRRVPAVNVADTFRHTVVLEKNGEEPHNPRTTPGDQSLTYRMLTEGDYKITVTPAADSFYVCPDPPAERHLKVGDNLAIEITIRKIQVASLDIPTRDDVCKERKADLTADPDYATIPLWKQYINLELTQEAKNANAPVTDAKKNAVLKAAGPDVPKQDVIDATLADTPGWQRANAAAGPTIPLAEAKRMVADGSYHLRSHKMYEERANTAVESAKAEKKIADDAVTAAKTSFDADNTNKDKEKVWNEAKAKAAKAKSKLDAANARLLAAPGREMDPRSFGRNLEFEAKLNVKRKDVKVYFDLIRTPSGPDGNYPWKKGALDADDKRGAALKEKVTPFDALNGEIANTKAVMTDDQGACRVNFRLSRVGGDKYIVVAGLKEKPAKFTPADFTDGLGKKSRYVQTWRKFWYQLTYPQHLGVPPLKKAQGDFEKLYIVAEPECEVVYDPAEIAGLSTTSKWQFDNSIPKGTLYPGKSATVTVEVVAAEAEKLGARISNDIVKFKDVTDSDQLKHVTVQRRAEVVAQGELNITAGDWEPEMSRGNPAGVARKVYTIDNIGGRTVTYTVGSNKDWLNLDTLGGSLSPGAGTTLTIGLNNNADGLAQGTPADTATVTFTNEAMRAGARHQPVIKRSVKIKVTGEGRAGRLEVRPLNGFTSCGAVNGAFAPAQSPAYTLKNTGFGSLHYRVTTGKPWLKLGGDAWNRVSGQVQRQKETSERSKASLQSDRQAALIKKANAEQQLQDPSLYAVQRLYFQVEKTSAETRIRQIDAKLKILNDFLADAPSRLVGNLLEGWLSMNGRDTIVLQIDGSSVTALESDIVRFTNLKDNSETIRTVTLAAPPELTIEAGDWAPAKFKAGEQGAPVTKVYEIENSGGADLKFTASRKENWILLDVTSGTLAAKAKRKVRVETTEDANAQVPGSYEDKVKFKNDTNDHGTGTRKITLVIDEPGTKLDVKACTFSTLGTYDTKASKMKGAFDPPSIQYSVKNTGKERIQYTVSKTEPWLRITSENPQVSVGGDNRDILRKLIEQPVVERPKTAHLILCDRQWDPKESKVMTFSQKKRTDWFYAKNRAGDKLGAFLPPLQGGRFFVNGYANKWTWDGHEGPLTDAMVTLDRDRDETNKFNITLPLKCPDTCPKPDCGGGTDIEPTDPKPADVEFKVNGAEGPYLGEGGKEESPHALIVIEDTGDAKRDESSINDTVSHEVGHMYHQVQHTKGDAETYLKAIKDNWKEWKKGLKGVKAYYDTVKKDFEYYYEDGTPDHGYEYTGRGGQGSHCAKGATPGSSNKEFDNRWPINQLPGKDKKTEVKEWDDGSCILYASGRDQKLEWCDDCQKIWKYIDLKRFTYS